MSWNPELRLMGAVPEPASRGWRDSQPEANLSICQSDGLEAPSAP